MMFKQLSTLGCLMLVATLTACVPTENTPTSEPQTPEAVASPQANAGEPRTLQSFSCLSGTDYELATIQSSVERLSAYETFHHNYVFFNRDTLAFNRLFDNNLRMIKSTFYLVDEAEADPAFYLVNDVDAAASGVIRSGGSVDNYDGRTAFIACDHQKRRVELMGYLVIDQDTNGDNRITGQDTASLGLSDVDGRNYTALISDIKVLLETYVRKEKRELIVMYRTSTGNKISLIDLATKSVISTDDMPDFGTTP